MNITTINWCLKTRVPASSFYFIFNIMFLLLRHTHWSCTAFHIVFSYFIKLAEQCLQFERCHPYIQKVNKTSSFKTKCIGSDAEASRVNHNTIWCLTFPRSRQQTSCYELMLCQFWAEQWAPYPPFKRPFVFDMWKLLTDVDYYND